METKVVTAHISLPLADKIEDFAQRLERPKAWIVKQALTAWVDLEEQRYRLTLEAMADVDKGNVVDHSSVQAWAESLDTNTPLSLPRKPDSLE